MKVLAVSDVVNRRLYSSQVREIAGGVDLIISCGDLPAYYLDFLVSTLCKPLLYVCGNHDEYDIPMRGAHPLGDGDGLYNVKLDYNRGGGNFGGRNLDGRIEVLDRRIFCGLEGSVRYNQGDHQYTQSQMSWKVRKLAPVFWKNRLQYGRCLDVLVTHAPPKGIHDLDDPAHRGFDAFNRLIHKYQPRYVLHGHTHLYQNKACRVTEVGTTQVINCFDYQILDLDIQQERGTTSCDARPV